MDPKRDTWNVQMRTFFETFLHWIFDMFLRSYRFLDIGKRFLTFFWSRYTYYQLCMVPGAHFMMRYSNVHMLFMSFFGFGFWLFPFIFATGGTASRSLTMTGNGTWVMVPVKIKNFFFASLIGIVPQIFLAVSIGSGLEKIIDQNIEVPKIKDVIFSQEIYIPILAFFSLVLITIFLRKSFYKN